MKRVTSVSLLLLLFCWAATAVGKISLWHPQTGATLSASLYPCNTLRFSDGYHTTAENHCLNRIPHNRKITALVRLHLYSDSDMARNAVAPPDTLSPENRQPYLSPSPGRDGHAARLSRILLRTLQLPPQQNRLGGWKESNILYRQVSSHSAFA